MQYKTIVLELLKQRTELHDRLARERQLLAALEHYSTELKASHEALMKQLAEAKPESDPSQVASEASEIAIKEMEDHLDSQLPSDDEETLSLDGAMAFIRRHTPPA